MKSATTILACSTLLSLTSAIPAPVTEIDLIVSSPILPTNATIHLLARKVEKYKPPQSWEGTCGNGGCMYKPDSFALPARCRNSHCERDGGKCIVAYSSEGPSADGKFVPNLEAKCPVNDAGYEWDWPWVDVAWKEASERYEECLKDHKALPNGDKEKDAKVKADQKVAKAAKKAECEGFTGGPA